MPSFAARITFVALLLFFHSQDGFSQYITIQGTVKDTSGVNPLNHAVVMAVRLSDSTLTKFIRTDDKGFFRMDSVPADTYQVVLSHPGFGDQMVIVLGSKDNNSFDLQKVTLPPKTVTLNEVTIFGYKDAVYFKGDTLIYTADSFKVKKDAVVEDLLKKLPGIRVDSKGKIFSQGKAVDQVLVDGDEFFGSDPTIATKNLAAKSVESVQVYDKKNEDATESTDKETLKIMDLKLKEEAKKGYFGKVSGAGDFNNFYEGEVLANHFQGKQKISVFLLGSNTPRTALNWRDMYQYGLTNEYNNYSSDDEGMSFSFDSDRPEGIPKTQKAGFYYNDMIGKKTKLGLNYTYNKSSLFSQTSTASQYFLTDTTYKTNNYERSDKQNDSHSVNMTITETVDSLTDIVLESKLKSGTNSENTIQETSFLNAADAMTRSTAIDNGSSGTNRDWLNSVRLTRNFKKRDRKLIANYTYDISDNSVTGIFKSYNTYFNNALTPNDSIDQKKTTSGDRQTHTAFIKYTEPLSKKIKLGFNYNFSLSDGSQDKKTLDFVNGDYNTENAELTNSFKSTRTINRVTGSVIYEVKKQRIALGMGLRQVDAMNTNMVTQEKISQVISNNLPYASYRFKFSDSQDLSLNYNTNSDQPSVTQLQPVPDNSNPNYIVKGNPDLLPTYRHEFRLNYYEFKMITGRNIWSNASFTTTNNAFSNATTYDSIGRTISQPVNVQGNYNGNLYLGGSFPFAARRFEISPNGYYNFSRNANFINGQKNITKESGPGGSLEFQYHTDSLEFSIGGNYNYHYSSSSLSTASNSSYYTQGMKVGMSIELPLKMKFETEANYSENNRREQGYNLHFILWNALLSKRVLKNENLIISVDATDLLNQNISTRRDVQDNVISDIKTNVIGRYILLKAEFKFNSNKKKEEDGME